MASDYMPWREAMNRALYGPGGFYLRPEGPAGHFRTSTHVSPQFAAALARLAARHGLTTIVDVGAGRGELLRELHAAEPGFTLIGVERASRPADLPEPIDWRDETPSGLAALVVANEWLDNVPVDVVEMAGDGRPRLVLVQPASGDERLGPEPDEADLAWLEQWWPLPPERTGVRAEIGRDRDEAWAGVVRGLGPGGLAVAIDYGHQLPNRPIIGTLTGYRRGRSVPPVPDGSCDLTAHVAFDSVAAAAQAVGASKVRYMTQSEALRQLGLDGSRPPLELAHTEPTHYVRALARATEAAELLDPFGLGGLGWLHTWGSA